MIRLSLFVVLAATACLQLTGADALRNATHNGSTAVCVPLRQELHSHLNTLLDFINGNTPSRRPQAPKKASQKQTVKSGSQKSQQKGLAPPKANHSFLQIASRLRVKARVRMREHALDRLRAKLFLETYVVGKTIKENFANLAILLSENRNSNTWPGFDTNQYRINCQAQDFMDKEAATGKADAEAAADKNVLLKARIMYYTILAEFMWWAEEEWARSSIPAQKTKCFVPRWDHASPANTNGDHIMNFGVIGFPLFDSFLGDPATQDRVVNSISAKKFSQNATPAILMRQKQGQLQATENDNNAFMFEHLRQLLLQTMYPYVKGKAELDALYALKVGLITTASYNELKTHTYNKGKRDDWTSINKFNTDETVHLRALLPAQGGPDFSEAKKTVTINKTPVQVASRIALNKPAYDFLDALRQDDSLLDLAFTLMIRSSVDLTALVRACYEQNMIETFKYKDAVKKGPRALVTEPPFSFKFNTDLKVVEVTKGVIQLCQLGPNDQTRATFIQLVLNNQPSHAQLQPNIDDQAVKELCTKIKDWENEESTNKDQAWVEYHAMMNKLLTLPAVDSFNAFLARIKA